MSKKKTRKPKSSKASPSTPPATGSDTATSRDGSSSASGARATSQASPGRAGKGPSAATSRAAARAATRQRRHLLLGLCAVPVLAFGGVALHRHDVESRTRHDLSVLGAGVPVVVQVHDPSCPMCRRLMAHTLTALEERDDILYRIADLTTTEGADMGREYGVGKVTLLLFDETGRHVDTVQGVTPADELTARFDERFGTSGAAAPS